MNIMADQCQNEIFQPSLRRLLFAIAFVIIPFVVCFYRSAKRFTGRVALRAAAQRKIRYLDRCFFMAKSRSEYVLINTTASFAMKLVGQLMKFVLKTAFIYTLGIQYASVSTLFSDILSVLALAELGIGSAITYSLYKPIRENNEPRIAALMHFYKQAYRLIALFVLVAGLCCIPFLSVLVKDVPDITEDIRLIFVLYIVNTAASYLFVFKSTLLTASQRRYVISRISITFSFIRTAAECAALFLFQNYIVYLTIGIVEAVARNYTVSRAADKAFPGIAAYKEEKLSKAEKHRLFGDVKALSLYRMSTVILNSTDSIIISAAPQLGVVSVGYLGNYRLIVNTIDELLNQFFNSLTPSLGNMAAAEDANNDRQYDIFKTLIFSVFWCTAFCCASLLTLSTPFIKTFWLGKDYVMPFSIPAVLVFNFYINNMMRPVTSFRNSNGLFVQGRWRPLFMALTNVVFSLALVKPLGVFGVLVATGLSRLCTQAWFDPRLVYRNVFNRPVSDYFKRFILYSAVTAACCLATYGAASLVASGHAMLDFLIKMVLCLLIPNLIVMLIFHKTDEYRQFTARICALAKKILRRFIKK